MIVGICENNTILNFSLFLKKKYLFSIYKMADSIDIYKSYINIGTVMKNPETLKFVPDHFITKKNV